MADPMSTPLTERPAGIPGSGLSGPWPVGAYAAKIRDEMRKRPHLQLFGEVWGLKVARVKVYFELRDATGALPCSMWRNDFDTLALAQGALADGVQVVVAGGPDYYPGSRTSSPGFSFAVTGLRVAGEGDLLAQLDRLRKLLDGEGLFAPQKALGRPLLPKTIGVVTSDAGKARDDVLAGLRRRGWAGRLVWGFAPVQDRHAAGRITSVLQDLAATGGVDVIIVARGGGSLADLFCFCDETLCRTVALLPVPVIASVGHHTDRTLLDDVAAVSCSTPTHAAEAAVRLDVAEAQARMLDAARRLHAHGRRSVVERARTLARLSRAPAQHVSRARAHLHQQLREIRAATARRIEIEGDRTGRRVLVLSRKATATDSRRRHLDALSAALTSFDPQRTLERGYAYVEDDRGDVVTSAGAAHAAETLNLTFADGRVVARPHKET
jgi:exodeoxyribonuclease VII large subunit